MRSGFESSVLGSRNNTLSPYAIHFFLVQQNVETPKNNTWLSLEVVGVLGVIFVFLEQNFLQNTNRISDFIFHISEGKKIRDTTLRSRQLCSSTLRKYQGYYLRQRALVDMETVWEMLEYILGLFFFSFVVYLFSFMILLHPNCSSISLKIRICELSPRVQRTLKMRRRGLWWEIGRSHELLW